MTLGALLDRPFARRAEGIVAGDTAARHTRDMPKFFYAVTATCGDASLRDEYVAWLLGGHIDGVLEGGAESGRVVLLDGDAPYRVEAQYVFPSRAAFDAYAAGPAVPLRADGVRRFGDRDVQFERRMGEIV